MSFRFNHYSFFFFFLYKTLLATLHFNMINTIAQSGSSWKPSAKTIARFSKGHPNIICQEEKVPAYTIPDPLITIQGKKVTNPDQWEKVRREEILDLFREHVYGRVPAAPNEKSFRVVNEQKDAMEGRATLKQVDITITSENKSLVIHLNIFLPNNVQKPVPVFFLISRLGVENIDFSRKERKEYWPAEDVIARGYGIAVFKNTDLDPDNFDDFKNGIHEVLDRGERKSDSWGTISAWAWGASRCMDYFETDKDIDHKKVALIGHSRDGKTALWAGTQDERFAMVISNESGSGGAALARRRFDVTVTMTNNSRIFYWFCSNYKKFSNNEDSMPVDQHMLLALIAPRALYVACADDDLWGDPKGSYLSLYYSVPVFKLLKTGSLLPEEMPPLNKQIISGKVAFHIRDGVHNLLLMRIKS